MLRDFTVTFLLGPVTACGNLHPLMFHRFTGHPDMTWHRTWWTCSYQWWTLNVQSPPFQSQIIQHLLHNGDGLPGWHLQNIQLPRLPFRLFSNGFSPGDSQRCNSVDGQMAWFVHIRPSAIRLSPLLLASRLGVRQEVEGDNPGGHFFTPSLNSFPESWIISYSLCQQSLQRQPLLAHWLQTTDFTTHCFNTHCLAWTSHFAGQYETKLSNW